MDILNEEHNLREREREDYRFINTISSLRILDCLTDWEVIKNWTIFSYLVISAYPLRDNRMQLITSCHSITSSYGRLRKRLWILVVKILSIILEVDKASLLLVYKLMFIVSTPTFTLSLLWMYSSSYNLPWIHFFDEAANS